eukprot:TRINITY_DN5250_c0_g1_i2.p1 TRINITY_DN5250_c0_g1~~TRINITY_DN5250_c0_g1_i2.p1  ORF type:complete len:329 (+),score=42.96 TRINITY_DN5250_c0_g1_i2:57-989(+)
MEPILQACRESDTQLIYDILNGLPTPERVNVITEFKDDCDYSLLHHACEEGDAILAELLLENGADIEECIRNEDWTPLHLACYNGNQGVVETLLAKGADLEALDLAYQTPLHLACAEGYTEIVRALLDNGANIEATCEEASTPFHLACENACLTVGELLLSRGANIEAKYENGDTALHLTTRHGTTHVIEWLIEQGANPWALTYGFEPSPTKTVFAVAETDAVRGQLKSIHARWMLKQSWEALMMERLERAENAYCATDADNSTLISTCVQACILHEAVLGSDDCDTELHKSSVSLLLKWSYVLRTLPML